MTYMDFLALSFAEQTATIDRKIEKLTYKRKDPIIDVIDLLRLIVDDSHNNTAWSVYRFDYTIQELIDKLTILNNKRTGEKSA